MDNPAAAEKLREQNEKLRAELKTLTATLNDAIAKHKAKQFEKNRPPAQAAELTNEKERELRKLHAKINRYKKEIAEMKKNIDGSLGGNDLNDLENEEKWLKKKVAQLEDEN